MAVIKLPSCLFPGMMGELARIWMFEALREADYYPTSGERPSIFLRTEI